MSPSDNVVTVPRPSPKSYNRHRKLDPDGLIRAQVKHFIQAEKSLPPELRSGVEDPSEIKTEGEAADYIRRVTAALHRYGGEEKVRRAT